MVWYFNSHMTNVCKTINQHTSNGKDLGLVVEIRIDYNKDSG